jgi:uncharacterized protein YmfQ (DUF2313 family)
MSLQVSSLDAYALLRPTDLAVSSIDAYALIRPSALAVSDVTGYLLLANTAPTIANTNTTNPVQYSFPTPPTWTQQEFATAFLRLLPQGLAWNVFQNSTMANTLYPLSGVYADNSQLAADLLIDIWPATTVQLSTEWQESLGLPSPCAIATSNTTQTQTSIVAQLVDSGDCSEAYFTGIANALGFAVTVTQFIPLRVGMPVGSETLDDSYAFIWTMTITSGSPASYLQCEMQRRVPAYTQLYVIDTNGTVYSPPPILNDSNLPSLRFA